MEGIAGLWGIAGAWDGRVDRLPPLGLFLSVSGPDTVRDVVVPGAGVVMGW